MPFAQRAERRVVADPREVRRCVERREGDDVGDRILAREPAAAGGDPALAFGEVLVEALAVELVTCVNF